MNKQAVWTGMLVVVLALLTACGAAATSPEPGVTAEPDSALRPAGGDSETLSDNGSDLLSEDEPRPVEDPVVIDSEKELELIPIPEEAMPESVIPENSPRVLSDIVADVFERSGSKSATVNVIKMEETTWRDGSLGCPEPGMMYTQALVDGYWIILEVDGVAYDYRATRNGAFRLCEQPTK